MKKTHTCPDCNGHKIIVGHCECNPEWRTSGGDDIVDDCICEPDQTCPTCKGCGVIG